MPVEPPRGNVKAIFDEAAEIASTAERAAYLGAHVQAIKS